MFADAYEKASCFTHPVIISTRYFDGTVQCGCGAFVVVNDEGWILTAKHMLESYFIYQSHIKEIEEYRREAALIEKDSSLNQKQKRKRINKLRHNAKWITHHSFWWGKDNLQLEGKVFLLPYGDLVCGKLKDYDASMTKVYPQFKDPKYLRVGTSLCRLGFPLYEINASFDETTNHFQLAEGTLPIPRFPIEGIYTRNVNLVINESSVPPQIAKFIETSSPGLRGQSGGPIFDVNGTVWGIQSHTTHHPLGFSPKMIKNGKEVEENQFLNVGLGVHPESIVTFLKENNISFSLAAE